MAKKSNSEYWEERIGNRVWSTYNSMEDKNRELMEFYEDASKNIREELYRLAEKHSRDGVLSLSDMYKQDRLTKLNKRYENIVYELSKKIEDTSKGNMQEGFKDVYSSVGIYLGYADFAMPNSKLMEELLDRSWLGSNFSKRLWGNQKKLAAGLNNILLTGLQQGKTAVEITVSLNSLMNKGFNVTHRLVRTESIHYLNSAALQRYKDSGIGKVQIWAAADERTCEYCMQYHGKTYDIDKAPILPLHANCRCVYLPVVDDIAAKQGLVYKNEPVYYDEKNDYSVKIEGYSDIVNKGLSKALEDVAKRGSEDRCEHMHLVNLKTGAIDYSEDGDSDSVGYKFSQYVSGYPDEKFAFIHNHNIISSLSEADLTTPIINQNIVMQVAVQNDGVKYIAQRMKDVPEGYYADFYFEEELENLNKLSRDGKITPIERIYRREEIIVEGLIREFYGGKVMVLDGRKNK